jgi:hypothetical protein
MDYMSSFPSTEKNHNCVFVALNQFSNVAILEPHNRSITFEATAQVFFDNFWVHFGIPRTFISDMDNRFLNTFWSYLWSLMNTNFTKSTSFHPQIEWET